MFCPQCGTETGTDSQYCPSCGVALPVPEPVPVAPAPPAPAAPAPAAPVPAAYAPPAPPAPPVPAYVEPAPVYAQPAPAYVEPAPVYAQPAPTYAEPAPVYAPAVPAQVFQGWSKAPLFPRFLASIIDSIIMQPLMIPAAMWMFADAAREVPPIGGGVLMALGGLWMFVYAYIKDGLKGASFGKRITGLMVVNLTDQRPARVGSSIVRALILSLLGPIEAIIVLVDKGGQRLGDKLAKTQVIRMSEYEAAAPGWPRPGKGLAIALLVITLLVGIGGGIASGIVWAGALGGLGNPVPGALPAGNPDGSGSGAVSSEDQADVDAAIRVVEGFYTAINDANMEAIKASLTEDLRDQVEPGVFEGWSTTEFEFTRGWLENGVISIIGRESQQAYGAGDGGGVKFQLVNVAGTWLIDSWTAVDQTQVEGSDTTGASTGLPGPLSESVAIDLVTQALEARRTGAGNVIRRLASPRFIDENGAVWLDGIDNSDYFTTFTITSVKVETGKATVRVSETWIDGTNTSVYGLIETDGVVLLDSWTVQ